jgi:ankyrin repeat protein
MKFSYPLIAVAITCVSCVPPSAWNMPPVIGAARSGDTGQLEKLLAEGADPNVRAGVNDWTPLEHAIHKNQEGSVRVLLAFHADVDARGGGGVTPLIMAAGYGYENIVRILLEAGADPKLKAGDGSDALMAAVGGVPDIDRFTVGHCQAGTVRVLLDSDKTLRLTPSSWTRAVGLVAKVSGCDEVIKMVSARQAATDPRQR